MTDCSHLDDYLDRDLNHEDVVSFREHLRKCDECRGAVEESERIAGDLREAWNEIRVPTDEQSARVHEQAVVSLAKASDKPSQPIGRPSRSSGRSYFLMGASIAAVMFLAVFSLMGDWSDWLSDGPPEIDSLATGDSQDSMNANEDALSHDQHSDRRNRDNESGESETFVTEVQVLSDTISWPVDVEDDFTLIMIYPVETTEPVGMSSTNSEGAIQ